MQEFKIQSGELIVLKLDPGADINLINREEIKQTLSEHKYPVRRDQSYLLSYTDDQIETYGRIALPCKVCNEYVDIEFFITNKK